MELRKISVRLILFIILSLSLVGCSGGSGAGPVAGGVTISGEVQYFPGGSLEGVKVDVGGRAQAVTDTNGSFTTSSFPPGTYTISFSKEDYWTNSFPVTFEESGSFQFINPIFLSKTTNKIKLEDTPSFVRDLDLDTHFTIHADNKVSGLIALGYDTSPYQSQYQSYINITTDIGAGQSSTIIQGQSLKRILPNNKLKRRLRDFESRVNQSLFSKGIRPGVSKGEFRALCEEPEPQLTFYKYNFDWDETHTSVTADLIYSGRRCLIYLDREQTIDSAYIKELGRDFDNLYYNRMITYFGAPNLDVDGDDKVYILLSELPHDNDGMILGYFSFINEFSKDEVPYSNQKEMFYLTTYTYNTNPNSWLEQMKATSVHEFQHLINYSYRGNEGDIENWINEGLSMLAEDIAVAGPGRHNPLLDEWVEIYLKYHRYDCLQDWQEDALDYASAYMFMRYFADRYGETVIRKINTVEYVNVNVNDVTLVDIVDASSFSELFLDWLTAVILDAVGYTTTDSDLSKKYLYQTLDLTGFDLPRDDPGYIYIARGAGAFIYMPDLTPAKRIEVIVNGEQWAKYRLIMLPAPGNNFLISSHAFTRIK